MTCLSGVSGCFSAGWYWLLLVGRMERERGEVGECLADPTIGDGFCSEIKERGDVGVIRAGERYARFGGGELGLKIEE